MIEESFMEYRSGEQYSMKEIISLTKNLVTVLQLTSGNLNPDGNEKTVRDIECSS